MGITSFLTTVRTELFPELSAPTTTYNSSLTGMLNDRYLVDSASSHMLVPKIKPCMSKYKRLYGETANGSLNQLLFI